MSRDRITPSERKAAAFIAEYEALCRKHGAMVIMVEVVNEDYSQYSAFAVGCFNNESFLEQALEEMRLEYPKWVEESA